MNRPALAAAAALAVLATGCGGGEGKTLPPSTYAPSVPMHARQRGDAGTTTTTTVVPKSTSVVIHPLFTVHGNGSVTGGVGEETVSAEPASDKSVRVDFSENEVSGEGDQSRAASWSAVTVATLLTGAPLEGRYRFEINGSVDGPSAGALETVAVLSLMRGEPLKPGITMTGTINPDGTVGPVGGIPEKVKGASQNGIKTMLVPAGQRNAESSASGSMVDVVEEGRTVGVEVREVKDVYEAYEAFTGHPLPRLASQGDIQLDEKSYDRLKAKANAALARFDQAQSKLTALDPTMKELVAKTGLADQASQAAERALNLQDQGLQAGAFQYASQAAMLEDTAAATADALQV